MSIACVFVKYWSHIQNVQELPVHIFGRYWSIFYIFRKYQTAVRFFSTRAFQTCSSLCIYIVLCFQKYFRKWSCYFPWTIGGHLVSPQLKILGCGSPVHVQNLKIMERMTVRIFPKWNRKVTNPKRSRRIIRSFWATLFLKITIKTAPQTPQTPNPDFPRISRSLWRRSTVFALSPQTLLLPKSQTKKEHWDTREQH